MRLKDTRFVVLDVETTGLDPEQDRVVQLALVSAYQGRVELLYAAMVNPLRAIPPEVSAVHHITNRMVESALPFSAIWPRALAALSDADGIVAHNAAFDRSFVPETGKPWLCTKRLAQHLWPKAPNWKNQTLRYWLNLELSAAAHDAVGDTLVTAEILIKEIDAYLEQGGEDDLDALVRMADGPVRVEKMPFGKHFGTVLTNVPLDYLRWALRNIADMDNDLRWSIEQILGIGAGVS